MKEPDPPLQKKDFETLAEFRYQLRRFLRFSEEVTRRHGITHLQYLLLLHIKGFLVGNGPPSGNWRSACRPNTTG